MTIDKNTPEFQELLQKARIFFNRAYWTEKKIEEEKPLILYQLVSIPSEDLELYRESRRHLSVAL